MRIASILSYTNRLAIAATAILSCWNASSSAQIPCRYEVSATIAAPPCIWGSPPTFALAISPNGEYVCGWYLQCSNGLYKGFVYKVSSQQFVTLFPSGVTASWANDVSDTGKVVGWYKKSGVGQRGWTYDFTSGQYTEMPPVPPGNWSNASGITRAGVVCGERAIGSPKDPNNPKTAFVWTAANGFIDLGLINGQSTLAAGITPDGTTVAGTMYLETSPRAFLWSGGKVVDLGVLPDGSESTAIAVNAHGEVTGRSRIPNPAQPNSLITHAYFARHGAMLDCGTLPGHNVSVPSDVGDDGTVVGLSRTHAQNNDRAFIWRSGIMRDLNALIVPLSFTIDAATGIADNGWIAAYAHYTGGQPFITILRPTIALAGDVDSNCAVNIDDLVAVIQDWGATFSPADVNQDGIVNIDDLVTVIVNWTD